MFALLAAGLFAQEATDNAELVKKLKKQLRMSSPMESDFRDESDQKFFRIKVTTTQNEDDSFIGTLRITVELTGKDGTTRCGQAVKKQSAHPNEYDGSDEWTIEIPQGDMARPKITAYAIEYGTESGKEFTPVIQDFDGKGVESAEQIMTRNTDNTLKISIKAKALRKDSGGDGN
jgi:hypothetical protein